MERKRGAWTKASPYVRRDGTATRGTTVYMPVELADALRKHAFDHDRKQTEIIVEAIRTFLAIESLNAETVVPTIAANNDRRLVERKGRLRSDGSRTDASSKIRSTVYLNPSVDRYLSMHAASNGTDRSAIIGDALVRWIMSEKVREEVSNGK